jgi:lipopolysaccharide export system protein LptC
MQKPMSQSVPDHFESTRAARERAREALSPLPVMPQGDSWDRFIIVMRLVLPVLALVVGGMTVLWPFINEKEVSFTLSREEVAKSDGVIHMTNPRYVGTDSGNRLFSVEASSGRQEDASSPRIRLSDIRAQMELQPGNPAFVHARTGIYRMKDSTLSLVGGVSLRSAAGYQLEMDGAEIDLKAHTAVGNGNIRGASEIGQLQAGRMEILVDTQEGVFEDGVKMSLVPRRPQANGPKAPRLTSHPTNNRNEPAGS